MPLTGLRVVELDGGYGVAYCGRVLAGLGADVVLVEPPQGSRLRHTAPFVGGVLHPETAGLHLYLHAGKRSVTADRGAPGGRQVIHSLLADADLLLHGLRSAEAAALGLDAAGLAHDFPRLIVTAVTPFGLTGPRAGDPGGDLTAFHGGGYGMATTRAVTDPVRQPPLRGPGRQAEYLGGLAAVAGALAALRTRRQTGRGGVVDLSLEDTIVTANVSELRAYADGKRAWDRREQDTLAGGVVAVLPCADGLIAISPREEHQWQRWLDVIGRPAWAGDPRYATRAGRARHWHEIEPRLAAFTRTQTKDALAADCQAHRVAAFPVSTVTDLLADPQLGPEGRDFFREVVQPVAGKLRLPSAPFRLSATPWRDLPAPLLGEANLTPRPPSLQGRGRTGYDRAPPPLQRRGSGGEVGFPLAGVRVLDLTWVIGGPFCTRILAALGADVVRLETAARPEFADRGGFFPILGAGKRSCALNLGEPRGRELAGRLVAVSDVLVENFSAGVVERMGLGWEEVHARNPGLIMLSASGLGRQGPRAAWLAYGSLLQAYTGWAGLIGFGEQPHVGLGGAWVDVVTGYTAAVALLAALHHRDHTGEGQRIDLSMAESAIALMPEPLLEAALAGRAPRPQGNRAPDAAPHGVYPTKDEGGRGKGESPDRAGTLLPPSSFDDRWVAIAAYDDAMWQALVGAMGSPAWADEPRFAALHGRKAHEDELDARIAAWTAGWERQALVAHLRRAGVAVTPVRHLPDVLADPHLAARGVLAERERPDAGPVPAPRLPWRDGDGFRGLDGTPAALGEHGRAVLGSLLGLSDTDIDALEAAGVAG